VYTVEDSYFERHLLRSGILLERDSALARDEKKNNRERMDAELNIYVGNLSYEVTEEELTTSFGAHGQVDTARIITDRDTGRSKGFGFVEMANSDEAKAAIEALNGTEMGGRTLTVNEARPREQRPERRSDERRW